MASAFPIAATSVAPAAQVTARWLGGSGNWTDATKWSTGVVPDNGADTYAVNIDNGNPSASRVALHPGLLKLGEVTIDSLAIDADDVLLLSHAMLTIEEDISLQGELFPGAGATVLLPANTSLHSGTIRFGDSVIGQNSTYARVTAASGSLTLDGALTVVADTQYGFHGGFPTLGSPTTQLINRVRLRSDGFFRDLNIAGSTIENIGGIEVADGGYIGIDTTFSTDSIGRLINNGGTFGIIGTLDNTGRVFRVDDASGNWALHGTIRGGAIETGDGRALAVPFSSIATLDDVCVNGRIDLTDRLIVPAGQAFHGSGEVVIVNSEALEGYGSLRADFGETIIANGLTIRGGVTRDFWGDSGFPGDATVGGSPLVRLTGRRQRDARPHEPDVR